MAHPVRTENKIPGGPGTVRMTIFSEPHATPDATPVRSGSAPRPRPGVPPTLLRRGLGPGPGAKGPGARARGPDPGPLNTQVGSMFNWWKSNNKQIKTIFTFLKMQPNTTKSIFILLLLVSF